MRINSYSLPLAGLVITLLAFLAAPTAGADDRTCTTTSGKTTVCSRPGGSTAITTAPPVVGPYSSCGFGVGMEYMCDGGITWNMGGIFSRN